MPATCPILLSALLATAPVLAAKPLTAYPGFDDAGSRPVLVVATLRAGEDLPQFAHCSRPDVICIDGPPFVLEADVLEHVHGEAVPARLQAATTSHYGKARYQGEARTHLARLRTDGREYVMERYAAADLVADRVGRWHLVVTGESLPWWLPCGVGSLRREFVDGEFAADLAIPDEHLEEAGVDAHPELFRLTATGAMPRFSIPVAAIREYMAALPADAPLECDAE